MNSHPCCAVRREMAGARIAKGDPRSPARGRGRRDLIGSIFPAAILVLLPKCPACLAAYVAITGIGLTLSAATYLRLGLLVLCVVSLAYVAARQVRGIRTRLSRIVAQRSLSRTFQVKRFEAEMKSC